MKQSKNSVWNDKSWKGRLDIRITKGEFFYEVYTKNKEKMVIRDPTCDLDKVKEFINRMIDENYKSL